MGLAFERLALVSLAGVPGDVVAGDPQMVDARRIQERRQTPALGRYRPATRLSPRLSRRHRQQQQAAQEEARAGKTKKRFNVCHRPNLSPVGAGLSARVGAAPGVGGVERPLAELRRRRVFTLTRASALRETVG
jgi:hypothetical protein